jgi:hypothetical protein
MLEVVVVEEVDQLAQEQLGKEVMVALVAMDRLGNQE